MSLRGGGGREKGKQELAYLGWETLEVGFELRALSAAGGQAGTADGDSGRM